MINDVQVRVLYSGITLSPEKLTRLMQRRTFATRVAIRLWRSASRRICSTFISTPEISFFLCPRAPGWPLELWSEETKTSDTPSLLILIHCFPESAFADGADGRVSNSREASRVSIVDSFAAVTGGTARVRCALWHGHTQPLSGLSGPLPLLAHAPPSCCSYCPRSGSSSLSSDVPPGLLLHARSGRGAGTFVIVGLALSRRSISISSSNQRLCFR